MENKVFWRAVFLLILVLIVFFYTDNRVKENKLLESPVKQGTAVPIPGKGKGVEIPENSRPNEGLSFFVGENVNTLIDAMGKPDRIEPSGYQGSLVGLF